MSGWGCPYEKDGDCRKVPSKQCEPGMKGCTLSGKFRFSSEEKNISRRLKRDGDSGSSNRTEKK